MDGIPVKHKLKLNDAQSEFIMISSPLNRKEINGIKIKIGEETLIASDSVKNVGVVMDCCVLFGQLTVRKLKTRRGRAYSEIARPVVREVLWSFCSVSLKV